MSDRRLSLEELTNLNPESLYIERPNLDPMWRDHLLWLLDNHPQRCLDLYRNDRKELKRLILRVVQRASLYQVILSKEGNFESDQVKELVYGKIVAPSDSLRDPEDPLNDHLKLKILNWSDNLNLKDSESI